VKNSAIVVFFTVAVALVLSFFAALALAKYRFTGRQAVHRPGDWDPDAPPDRAG